jgi:PiT family inorganic phosphate transporter
MFFGLSLILVVIIIIGFYMAWNIGANDLANSMASSVGAQAVSLRNAVILGGVLALIGAIFVGSHVADTIKSGIVNPDDIEEKTLIVYGAISALLGASFWITLATWKELPISTTHSIVGGMMGFGIAAGGWGIVNWAQIGKIAASWVISPVLGGFLAFFMFKIILRFILQDDNPLKAAKRIGPIFIAITFMIIASSILFKTPLGKNLEFTIFDIIILIIIVGLIAGLIGSFILTRYFKRSTVENDHNKKESYKRVEHIFSRLQLMTACYVAFALGANDVANAIGPVATAFTAESGGDLGSQVSIPYFLLIIGGVGIIIGMFTWGYKVIKTIGSKITHITNTRGFSVEFGAATSVLIASKMGMPVSTTHAVVGAVIGVGLARGLEALDLSIIKKIVITWVITVPIAAVTTAGIFMGLVTLFPA